jgi:hypothetical protein
MKNINYYIILIFTLLLAKGANSQSNLPAFWSFVNPSPSGSSISDTFATGPSYPGPAGWTTKLDIYSGSFTYVTGVDGNAACRLDASGEYVMARFNVMPGSISYYIKGTGISPNPAFSGTFKVQEGPDTINWNDMATFTSMSGSFAKYQHIPRLNTRFIRFFYTSKISGSNVALDSVLILPKLFNCSNPTLSITMQDTLIGYKSESVTLLGSSNNQFYKYFWNTGDTLYNNTFYNLPLTKYNLTFFDSLGNCGKDSLKVAFINGIKEKDTSICIGVSKVISIQNIGLVYKYLWNTSDTTNTINVSPTTSTTYRCSQRIGSFTMIDSVRVTVNSLPIINSLPDTTIAFKQDSILLNAGTGYSKYIWSRGDTTQSIWVKTAGMNKVTVFNSSGCSNSDSTNVLIINGIQQKDTAICIGSNLKLSFPFGTFPSNGLIAWYPFNGNMNDESGNGNNGSNNGVYLSTDRFGTVNSSYYFGQNNNGSSGITITNNSILNFGIGLNKQFSISLWYYEDSLLNIALNGQFGLLLKKGNLNGNSSGQDYSIYREGSELGSGCGSSSLAGGDNCSWGGVNTTSVKNWHNYTVVFNQNIGNAGGTKNVYIDGVSNSSCNYYSKNATNNNPLYIGSAGFKGKIDDISIWNRTLTQTEIQTLYNGRNPNTKIIWSTSDTTNSINVSPTASTTYSCTLRIGSFTMTDSVRVTVNNFPIINSLQDTTIAFKQDSILLNAGVGYARYLWSKGDTTQSIWVKTAGMNKVTVFNTSGCGSSDSTKVLFVKGIINKDSSVCRNSNVILNALNQTNAKYLWSTGDNISSITKQINVDTVFKCSFQIGSFNKQDSVKIIVRNLPPKTINYNKKGLCSNDTIIINATNGYAYNWYKNNSPIVGASNVLKAFAIGNYKVKLTDSTGCSSMSDSVNLFNAPLPKAKISLPDSALCIVGNVFKFTDSTSIDSGTYNINWTFGNGNTSTLTNSNQSFITAGNYVTKLKVISNYGCADSVTNNITVKPNPVAGTMLGQVINLTPSTPYIYTVAQQINHLYNWVVTNGIVVLGQSTNAATVQWINNGDGYIKVEVTNPQGCKDTTAVATKTGNVGMNETSDINNLSLYPNPNYGSFTVGFTLKESSATKLELINMIGQQVWISNMQLQNGDQQIPINFSLSAGVYVLKISTSSGEITKQVLVK